MRRLTILILTSFCTWYQTAGAQQAEHPEFSPTQIDFFENRIRPLLIGHCLACHGAEESRIRGGLRLTSRESMLQGGDSGPAIVPGEPNESLLIHAVQYEDFEMPPDGQLNEQQISDLVEWIEMGAPDPRDRDASSVAEPPIDIQAGKQFWAFQPRRAKFEVGKRGDDSWPRTTIDRLIQEHHITAEIEPVVDADREPLIRRVYLALIGLPPTIEQIDAFVNDPADIEIALAEVIDGLLLSPRFGERWGRHWLDVARFAESSGGGRSLMFPDAWRFRDYVIDSYNKDKPFDQFIKEQIAGDLLPYDSHDQKIEQIVATGFLALGPTNYEQQDKELLRLEVIDEQVDTVGRAFLGLTLGCARCHDHKFDPIPMTDYYALAGIFGSTVSLVDGNVSKYVESPLATEAELKTQKEYRDKVKHLDGKLASANVRLGELGGIAETDGKTKSVDRSSLPGIVIDDRQAKLIGNWKASTYSRKFVDGRYIHDLDKGKGGKQAVFTPKLESGGRYEVRVSYSPGGNRASNVPVTIDHQDGKTTVLVNQSQKPPVEELFVSVGTYRFEADNQSSVTISTRDTDGHVIVDAVQFLLAEEKSNERSSESNQESKASDVTTSKPAGESAAIIALRREIDELNRKLTELKKNAPRPVAVAMSVMDAEHPQDGHLLIRGAVRRAGPVVKRGFVSVCCSGSAKPDLAADQSGRLQLARWLADPDHPLTARVYVNRVWRQLFGTGLVATPDNFGQMGQRPSHPLLLDYLASEFVKDGWSTKKLIRKIMLSRVYRLATAGDPTARSVDPENRLLWRANRRRVDAEVLRDSILFISGELDLTPGGRTIRKITEYDLGYEFDTVRRSVYVPAFRNSMLDLFEVFDFANPNLVTGNRNTSTLPTQALFLMNSPMVIKQSRKAAERLLRRTDLNNEQRISWVYRQVLGRGPQESELKETREYLESFSGELEGWSSVYHTLFASLDFRYVE